MQYLVQHFIEHSLTHCGEAPAVQQGAEVFSYQALETMIQQFIGFYQRHGLKKGDMIGILSRVRVEAIAAMIAALRSGIVYVPLNIHAPAAWVGNIIEKSGIKTLLTDPEFQQKAEAIRPYGLKSLFSLGKANIQHPDWISFDVLQATEPDNHWQCPNLMADDLAYILYTSGSTGDPKGILITHRNAYTFIDWMRLEFKVTPEDRILSRAPLQFDLSVFDIFSTLAAGACLVIPELGFSNRPQEVLDLMRREKISVVYTVPSAYIGWLTKADLDRGLPVLRLLLYAGEPFPTPYLRRVMQCLPGTWVSNIYGPTETNIVTFYHLYEPPENDDPVPLGHTVHDTEAFIVDEDLKQVPDGEIGEILIRGGTVFGGYFNDPELTRKKLVQSPFHGYPTLCCRTGDYGRVLPDGNLAYHGRMDNMIKSRGYRVEIGEVEVAISGLPGIDEVAVIPKPHEKYGNTLHAFIVTKEKTGHSLTLDDLKEKLATQLPSYMLPFEWIVMEGSLPKTATGKVDRVGLAAQIS